MTRTNALTKETFGKSGAPRALKKEGNKKIKPTMASNTKTEEKIHHFEAKITCPSNRDALVLKNSLSVDPELNPTKVDRSAAYAARWVAKSLVSAGLVRRCLVQVSVLFMRK